MVFPTAVLYLLFFFSGLSGLIYQVVWVREFGNVFGNTIYSASIVTAVFMLGLGTGSYVVGSWADRRYIARPESLVRTYGHFELLIGLMGLGISFLLPHLGRLSAMVSSYSRDAGGWHVLSTSSYLARAGIATFLLAPITMLMGGTLPLLIRHLVRSDVKIGGRPIARLYGINTAGAALGCLLTDSALVPAVGLRASQEVAALFNFIAAAGALLLASSARARSASLVARSIHAAGAGVPSPASVASPALALTGLALGLSGFAAMGMEIVWFRHFTLLLGVFRAVYSLLLAVILIGIGVGALVGGFLTRSTERSASWLIVVLGLFVASALFGLANADVRGLTVIAQAMERTFATKAAWAQSAAELWFNALAIFFEVGLAAFLMGFAFPLANAMIQRAENSVGRLAGLLYLCNTIGAVCGAIGAGFVLLPMMGIQDSATILAIAGWLAVIPLYASTLRNQRAPTAAFVCSTLIGGVAVWLWLLLPANHVINRSLLLPAGSELVSLSEGITEIVAVTDDGGGRRWLLTNGHPMSSTGRHDQRYMRALAHIPLLCIDDPKVVLVIGFGVGNTTHAATLHPSIRRVEVAELSRQVLEHAGYFKDANRDVLNDPRVVVYINDGRQHLQMQPAASYDVIALEPPPIAQAGVGALYSREFYTLVRSRLRPKGYISQWLPAYQVPAATTLAMIRAFVEVFPQAVLLSGAQPNLQLLGANDLRVEIEPARVAAALSRAPAVQQDLQRLDLGSVREIVGTFLGSAQTLAEASRHSIPVSDDRPLQEYSVRSLLNFRSTGAPSSVVNLSRIADWCRECFVAGKPVPLAEGLDTYLSVLARAYMVPIQGITRDIADPRTRQMIKTSEYLDAILRNGALVHDDLGLNLMSDGRLDEAIGQFEEALRLQPELGAARRNLAAAQQVRRSREGAEIH